MRTAFRIPAHTTRRLDIHFTAVVACLAASMPMWSVARNFSEDWYNHLWLIENAGYHLWLSGASQDVVNTPQAVGIPILLFYSLKFYTILGGFSFVLGSALTVRLAAYLLLLVQFYHVQRAVRASGAPSMLRLLVPILVTWQVFQATTLYERGDVTEYCATILLTLCVTNLYVVTIRTIQRLRDPYGFWTTGLYYGLAALTHPLTAVYGGAFVALTGLALLVALRSKRMFVFASLNLVLLGLLLAPWLWVMLCFAKQSRINDADVNAAAFVANFGNLPVSTLLRAFSAVSFHSYAIPATTPAMVQSDLQLSLPLLVLVAALALAAKKFPLRESVVAPPLCTLLATTYVIFWITLLVYCSPGCSFLFGHAFDVLQFAFRLGSYVNLALLLGTYALLGLIDWHRVRAARLGPFFARWGAMALFFLSGVGWFSKCCFIELSHFYSEGANGLEALLHERRWDTRPSGYWVPGASDRDDDHLTDLPATGYFQSAYDVTAGLRNQHELAPNTPLLSLPFALGTPFGAVRSKDLALNERTLVMTNVNPFPWNELVLDGRPVPRHDLLVVPSLYGVLVANRIQPHAYALFVNPGRHTLVYRFSPDPPWRWLNLISWLTLAAWIIAGGWISAFCWRRRELPRTLLSDADFIPVHEGGSCHIRIP